MVGLTSIALIERKPSISRNLFSRYWRDVHGVMAARIPGFASYTQYHVTPTTKGATPFEGVAIVTFARAEDAAGLAESEVTRHIHEDEAHVFRRALLYTLTPGADRILRDSGDAQGETLFHILPAGTDPAVLETQLLALGPRYLAAYDLSTGDPAGWNQTDVDDGGTGPLFIAAFHSRWDTAPTLPDTAAFAYRLDEAHVMVENGHPTTIGLRGLDAAKTIAEIGADNQLTNAVIRAVYGPWARP